MMSECNVEMAKEFSSPALTIGIEYKIPLSDYSLKITSIQCNALVITDNVAVIEVRKKGSLISNVSVNPDTIGILADNNKLCLSVFFYNCQGTPSIALHGWWNPSQKILVTNLDLPDYLLPVIGGIELEYTGIKSVDADKNHRYVFNVGQQYVQFGPGAFFGRILAPQFIRSIAGLIAVIAGFVLVWKWLDGDTQLVEAVHELQQENTDRIKAIQGDPTLTPEQKAASITQVLENEREAIEATKGIDWGAIAMWGAAGLALYAIIDSGLLKGITKTKSTSTRRRR